MSWTEQEIAQFERDLAHIPPTIGRRRMPTNTKQATVQLSIETDKMLDTLAERAKTGRSEVIRQLIVVGSMLLLTPYRAHEDDVWHSIRALRAQLGDSASFREEYPRG